MLKWNQAKHAYSSSSVGVLIRACAIMFLQWYSAPGFCFLCFTPDTFYWMVGQDSGLPVAYLPNFEPWTLHFDLTCLALPMRMTNPGRIGAQGYQVRASRTTEALTVKTAASVHLELWRRNELLFWTKIVDFPTWPCFIVSVLFPLVQHSHGDGNLGHEDVMDDANFGRLLVGSLILHSFSLKSSCCTLAILCCK